MLDITRGRSLATTLAPAGPVGDECVPQAAPPPGAPGTTPCRCDGTGAYTVDIPLDGAFVSDQRLCLDHGLTPRALLVDNATPEQRIGELMDVTGENPHRRAHLRRPGGGREWSTAIENLRPAPAPDASNAPGTGPAAADPMGSQPMTAAVRALLLRFGVHYDTIGRLEAAGLTTLERLADRSRSQLMLVPDMTEDGARTVERAIGKLLDIGYRPEQ